MKEQAGSQIGFHKSLWIAIVLAGFAGVANADSVSEPAVVAFGEDLAKALNNGDVPALEKLIDLDALAHRIARQVTTTNAEEVGFVLGFEKSASVKALFTNTLNTLNRTKGVVKMMGVVRRDDGIRALLRLDLKNSGFDYHEFMVEKTSAAGFRAVDWYQLSTGELVTNTIVAVSKLYMDPSPGLMKKLFGLNSVKPEVLESIKSIGKLEREGKFRDALAVIDGLPTEIGRSRVLSLKAVGLAAATQDRTLYRSALSKLADADGDNPATAFLLIDHYIYQEKLDKALRAMDLVEARVGRDGVTELLKANLCAGQARYDESIAHAKESIRLEPDRPNPYFTLANDYAFNGQFGQAVDAFKTVEKKFNRRFEASQFEKEATMKKFTESGEYKAWMQEKRN